MSSTYTGITTGLPAASVSITIPADGDNLDAASANVALQRLADWEEYFRVNAALRVYSVTGTGLIALDVSANGPGITTNVAGKFNAQSFGGNAGSTGLQGYGDAFGIDGGANGTNGVGVRGTSSGSAGTGVRGVGSGTGTGVLGTGGPNYGTGVRGTGGTGGTGDGYGGQFFGGGGAPGLTATAGGGATEKVAIVSFGTIDLDSSITPAAGVSVKNLVHKQNIAKAGARVTANNSTAPTIGDQHNIATLVQNTGTGGFQLTFAQAFLANTYRIFAQVEHSVNRIYPSSRSAAGISFVITDATGTPLSYAATNGLSFSFECFGEQ